MKRHTLSELKGKTVTEIKNCKESRDQVEFLFSCGSRMKLYHDQDCCEDVRLEEIVGDPASLIGSPLTLCEEINDARHTQPDPQSDSSYTWTFYKFATVKGFLTLRFLGESNGYYSEEMTCEITLGEPVKPKKSLDHLYAYLSTDKQGETKIVMATVAGRLFPGIVSSIEAAKDLEPFMSDIKKKSGNEVVLMKFKNPTVMRRL